MESDQTLLSLFPSERSAEMFAAVQPETAQNVDDCLAAFATELTATNANGHGRSPSDESLTRLRMAVAGFHSEMNKLKTQRANAQKPSPAAPVPSDTGGLWRRVRRFGLFAGCVALTVGAGQMATDIIGGADAAGTATLANAESVEAATIASRPVVAVAAPPLDVAAVPAAAAALQAPAIAPPQPRRASAGRAAGPRVAGSSGTAPRAPQTFKGSLVIDSVPQGGTVFINQSRVGVTPLRLDDYPAGSYALWVQRDGYQRWTAAVMVPANRVTQVTSKLTRQE